MQTFLFSIATHNDPELVSMTMTVKAASYSKAHNVVVAAMKQMGFEPGDYAFGVIKA